MSSKVDFGGLAERLAAQSGFTRMLPVIEKELLHYEILRALDKESLLDQLVFQGGTCLRLCYGSVRYSEDLDFVCGDEFASSIFGDISQVIERELTKRYDIEVTVKEPTSAHNDADEKSVAVNRWQVQVVTAQGRPDIPQQKVKIEIAQVPAYTKAVRPLLVNYEQLPPSYAQILLYTETLSEIVADKLVSLACASYVRYRDIWDLRWMSRQPGFVPEDVGTLVAKKVGDYHVSQDFDAARAQILKGLPEIVRSEGYREQMMRFLPEQVIAGTIAREKFQVNTVDEITALYQLTR